MQMKKIAALTAALLMTISMTACASDKILDSGQTGNKPLIETSGSIAVEPSLAAFKQDCFDYAKKAFDVEPGKDGINEDNILLTVGPALAGFWRVDVEDSPSEEEYTTFMTAFEQSEYWNHEWDNIDSELTYEQSAEVLSKLMDFCYENAVKNGWVPGNLPTPAPIPELAPESDSDTPESENSEESSNTTP